MCVVGVSEVRIEATEGLVQFSGDCACSNTAASEASASSPGVRSMGWLVMLGALSCCAVTLLVLPALLPGRREP